MNTETHANADHMDAPTQQAAVSLIPSEPDSRQDYESAHELGRLLGLAAAQIELAMCESGPAVTDLTEVFSRMAGLLEEVAAGVSRIPDEVTGDAICTACDELSADAQSAVVALQFYDRLTQRLGYVSDNLEMLAELSGDKNRLASPAEWQKLKRVVRKGYSGETEKALFDAMMEGATAANALQQVNKPTGAEWTHAEEMF